jgi:hypothetical protein
MENIEGLDHRESERRHQRRLIGVSDRKRSGIGGHVGAGIRRNEFFCQRDARFTFSLIRLR